MSNAIGAERIISTIANRKLKYSEIESKLGMKSNGRLAKQLASLLRMEIVTKTFPINKPDDNKKSAYEVNDNLLRFYYSYVYKNKSALQVLGPEAFYEEYVERSLLTFVSRRFEEIAREYFSFRAKSGILKGVTNIGTYYYDDSEAKTNGEFDVVLERRDIYDIFEVKYHSSPLGTGEMKKEEEQIKKTKGIQIGKIGFVSVSGFDTAESGFDLVTGEDLYS